MLQLLVLPVQLVAAGRVVVLARVSSMVALAVPARTISSLLLALLAVPVVAAVAVRRLLAAQTATMAVSAALTVVAVRAAAVEL